QRPAQTAARGPRSRPRGRPRVLGHGLCRCCGRDRLRPAADPVRYRRSPAGELRLYRRRCPSREAGGEHRLRFPRRLRTGRIRRRMPGAAAGRPRPAWTTEVERGLTLHGPGREDLSLMIGTHPAKGYASHGDTWSLALAMQLAGWDLLSADADSAAEQPVLVLDDVFAELDTGRRSRLASRITAAEQVFITAAVDSDLPEG